MSARKQWPFFGEWGGEKEGAREGRKEKIGVFFLLTSPSDCGCDKCPFRAQQFSQLRPGQAEALCMKLRD